VEVKIMMLADTILASLLLASGAAALPTMSPLEYVKRAVSPGVVIQKCTSPGMLALAYDDGPYQYTGQLVDILDKGGAKATFFWTGTLYGCIYKEATAVKKAFASGHQVASHSWWAVPILGEFHAY
jgi:peptidoglycan/xylan/chitin deacetylase (PgdA/CDA1 family)